MIVERAQSYPSNGPVTQATVDAALASIAIGAGGNGDDQDATAITGTAAKSASRRAGLVITNPRKRHAKAASRRTPMASSRLGLSPG